VQVKLLRVLQEGQFERLGGTQTLRVDVRIVAASKRDLAEEVQKGRFREDLYYRLNVIPITLPPLRDRVEDIPLLADHFLRVFAQKNGKRVQGIRRDAMELLTVHSWPGNVRELENAMERAVVLAREETIGIGELPAAITGSNSEARRDLSVAVGTPLAEVELRLIEETLRMTGGDKRVAAQLLGIATRTIYRKLEGRQPE
jgi:two-component system response regulator HydG